MTYSLNTLNADRQSSGGSGGVARFAQEIALVLGAAALAFWLLALLSHSLADPAWSTTGTSDTVGNWGGRLGAVLADASYYLLGFSVWWCFLLGVRLWLATLARWLRGPGEPAMQDNRPLSFPAWPAATAAAVTSVRSAGVTCSASQRFRSSCSGLCGRAIARGSESWRCFTPVVRGVLLQDRRSMRHKHVFWLHQFRTPAASRDTRLNLGCIETASGEHWSA